MTSTDRYPHIHNAAHGVLRNDDLPDMTTLSKP
jgi:hypothetical protein